MASMIDFDVTVDDWIAFQQFTNTGGISVATTEITITAITEEYVSFLRALTFMDCQIEEAFNDAIEEIRKRRKVDSNDYLITSKFNEASLSDVDDSTEDQTKEATGTNPVNDWLE
jgi:hypothetical protein